MSLSAGARPNPGGRPPPFPEPPHFPFFSATSEWIQFFKEAGIPPGPAVNYAVMFVDNRIQKNMLMDLNKEIMNELGITVVGDIIAILKHAKVVYSRQPDDRQQPEQRLASRRPAPTAAPRLHDLRHRLQQNGHREGLCDTAEDRPMIPVKRRRVTAEMEGKYIINMPRGTTPRTKKILEQQAAKGKPPKTHVFLKTAGLQRTSVFDRLGAEVKAATATGGKPTGVFSRLGDALGTDGDKATESDDDGSVLQYAGVLKKLAKPPPKESSEPESTVKAKATSSEAKQVPVTAATQRPGRRNTAGSRTATKPSLAASKIGGVSVVAVPVEAQDGDVTSTKDQSEPEFRVTIKRTWGCGKVSSTSESPGAQMDSAGTISVFKRLGRKPD
ncbi:uncharacterized protein C19orf47 homolog isoform X3 [Athene cunicularia]|uniref:uncharacterized protein C19orf47 homolog isoform X3 n=1 Tax=Athene cunicularia TaxID=194338 RepID=UPI000EF64C5A|nr:uncharacterized protein C19orf47 homolog isoform X3 [Athene cunicularia]